MNWKDYETSLPPSVGLFHARSPTELPAEICLDLHAALEAQDREPPPPRRWCLRKRPGSNPPGLLPRQEGRRHQLAGWHPRPPRCLRRVPTPRRQPEDCCSHGGSLRILFLKVAPRI